MRKKILIAAFLVFCGIIGLCNTIGARPTRPDVSKEEASQGHAQLLKDEQTNVKDVQEAIKIAQATPTPEPTPTLAATPSGDGDYYSISDLKKIFENSIVLGDSVVEASHDYQTLNDNSLVYKRGCSVSQADELIQQAIDLSPDNIFLVFGLNDLQMTSGHADPFIKAYKKQIKKLLAVMAPEHIFVNSIIPVTSKALASDGNYAHVDEFNQAMDAMCQEMGITFLDNGYLITEGQDAGKNMYEPDGIHPSYTYYAMWQTVMARAAGMIS